MPRTITPHRTSFRLVLPTLLALFALLASVPASMRAAESRSLPGAGAAATFPDETLLQDTSNGRVYLVWNNTRYHITSQAALAALGFAGSPLIGVPGIKSAGLPGGTDLGMRYAAGLVYPLSLIAGGHARLNLTPPSAQVGATITLQGSGFIAGEPVLISVAGVIGQATADPTGSFTATEVVPGTFAPGGVLRIYARGAYSNRFAVEPVYVIGTPPPPPLTVAPQPVTRGTALTIGGSGFGPSEQIDLFLAGGAAAGAATADGSGSFSSGLLVPSTLSAGTHSAIAFGVSSKIFAEATIQVVAAGVVAAARIDLSRYTAAPGSAVGISASGFAPNEPITISVGGTVVATVVASPSGRLTRAPFTVPVTLANGSYPVLAMGTSSGLRAGATLTVLAFGSSIAASPGSGMPGSIVTVSGQGFGPDERVNLALNGLALASLPRQIVAAPNGAFAASFAIPTSALPGVNTLTATGASSKGVATTTIEVSLSAQSTWYFAGGDTTPGSTTQIALLNPNGEPASIHVTFLFASGPPASTSLTVPANSRANLDPSSVVGPGRQVFTQITADRRIGAEQTVYRNGRDFSSAIGVSTSGRTWYLAEGYTGLSFHESIRILNPGLVAARVTLTLLPANGQALRSFPELVGPQSGTVIDVNGLLPNQSLSAEVQSDQGVVVDRLITFGPGGYGATEQAGARTPSSTWLFAEGTTLNGFETYLTILNPSPAQPATVVASFYDRNGASLGSTTIGIAPRHRGTIKVNNFVRSSGIATILTSTVPVVAERPLYFGAPNTGAAGGSDVFGRNGGGVRWLFPEGNTSGSFREFLLLQNPSFVTAQVRIRFYTTAGQIVDHTLVLPGRSRATTDVIRDVPGLPLGLHSALVTATNNVPIVAEQSIYADTFTKGDGVAGIAL